MRFLEVAEVVEIGLHSHVSNPLKFPMQNVAIFSKLRDDHSRIRILFIFFLCHDFQFYLRNIDEESKQFRLSIGRYENELRIYRVDVFFKISIQHFEFHTNSCSNLIDIQIDYSRSFERKKL